VCAGSFAIAGNYEWVSFAIALHRQALYQWQFHRWNSKARIKFRKIGRAIQMVFIYIFGGNEA